MPYFIGLSPIVLVARGGYTLFIVNKHARQRLFAATGSSDRAAELFCRNDCRKNPESRTAQVFWIVKRFKCALLEWRTSTQPLVCAVLRKDRSVVSVFLSSQHKSLFLQHGLRQLCLFVFYTFIGDFRL